MKFRIRILKDPHAETRGFSLKGIRVPLRNWIPVGHNEDVATFDGKKLPKGIYKEFWKISVEDVLRVRPSLERFLRRVDDLLVPTEFCDVAPIERWEQAWGKE